MFSKIRYAIDCLCVDIDEYSASINVCDALKSLNTICVNTIGSFSCICTNGYTQAGDGKIGVGEGFMDNMDGARRPRTT